MREGRAGVSHCKHAPASTPHSHMWPYTSIEGLPLTGSGANRASPASLSTCSLHRGWTQEDGRMIVRGQRGHILHLTHHLFSLSLSPPVSRGSRESERGTPGAERKRAGGQWASCYISLSPIGPVAPKRTVKSLLLLLSLSLLFSFSLPLLSLPQSRTDDLGHVEGVALVEPSLAQPPHSAARGADDCALPLAGGAGAGGRGLPALECYALQGGGVRWAGRPRGGRRCRAT